MDDSMKGISNWRIWLLPFIVLAITFGASVGLSFFVNQFVDQVRVEQFGAEANTIHDAIVDRLDIYSTALYGGRGLFDASNEVSRDEWRAYVESLRIQENFPGLQGFGYSEWIPPDDLEAHVTRVQEEGFPDYSIRPDGERAVYTSIVFLEPFDERNKQAFGFDMYQEEVRRDAMDRARNTGQAALSGRVTLVQEIKGEVQAGFLIYVPTYQKDAPLSTIKQRQDALVGYVYSPFRMNNFINGAITPVAGVSVEIFDGSDPDNLEQDRVMYGAPVSDNPFHVVARTVKFGGSAWTVRYSASQGYGLDSLRSLAPYVPLLVGGIVGIALFALTYLLNNRRVAARALANRITLDLKAEQQRLDYVIRGTNVGTWEWNIETGSLVINERWARILGYNLDELQPMSIKKRDALLHQEDKNKSQKLLSDHFRKNTDFYMSEVRMKHKEGHWVWVLDHGKVLSWSDDGEPLLMYGAQQEITTQKESQLSVQERAVELERLNKSMVGRELKMVELKKEIERLKQEIARHEGEEE